MHGQASGVLLTQALHASFSPFVLCVDDLMTHEAHFVVQHFARALSTKWSKSYEEVMDWVQLANVPVVSSPDQIFRAHPAVLSKNRVWTCSLVKLGHNHTSVLARCRTYQINCPGKVNCVYVITNSQLANILAAKQKLLVADNVINTYNYPTY